MSMDVLNRTLNARPVDAASSDMSDMESTHIITVRQMSFLLALAADTYLLREWTRLTLRVSRVRVSKSEC